MTELHQESIARLDDETCVLEQRTKLNGAPISISATENAIWAASPFEGVWQLDPASGEIVGECRDDAVAPLSTVADDGGAWVISRGGSLWRIDARPA